MPSSSSNGKNRTTNTSKTENHSNKNISSTTDKHASKQTGSQRVTGASNSGTGKMTTSKQDNKGKAAASQAAGTNNQAQGIQQPHNTVANVNVHPDAGLPPVSTQDTSMYPVDYFGLKGVLPQDLSTDANNLDTRYNGDYVDGDDDDEIDGADADASIRPITPSSIDASSSFTGSTSLHSLAPTSRTFKSFRTGHSKTSASTKPTLLGGGTGTSITAPSAVNANTTASIPSPSSHTAPGLNDVSTSPPNSVHSLNQQHRKDGSISQSLTLQSDKQKEKEKAIEATIDVTSPTTGGSSLGMVDMHNPEANRIATSLHGAEGVISSSPRSVRNSAELPPGMTLQPAALQAARQGPKASPLRNSFVGAVSNLATAPALSAAEEESDSGSQFAQQSTPRDSEWAEKTEDEEEENRDEQGRPDSLHMPEAHRTESSTTNPHLMRSSASITFSKLPPATPSSISSAQLYSAPGSPGRLSSYTRHTNLDREDDDNSLRERHNTNNDAGEGIYHYPRYSAPDPSNNPRASSPPPDNASMLTLASSTGGRAPSVYTAASRYRDGIAGGGGSIGGAPSIVDTAGNRYRSTANEDASIRAIAPSRRESTDSIGSKWSAAILSQKEGSYHAPTSGTSGPGLGDTTVSDNASFKKKTPSLRTVATSSSYYAAPSIPTTELKA